LRGPRPAAGLAGLQAAVRDDDGLTAWLAGLATLAAPLERLFAAESAELPEMIAAHLTFAEALAADDTAPGADRLWRGDAGLAAQTFMADLLDAADALPPFAGRLYPGLLRGMMDGIAVRPRYGRHPRLSIWGPLEARLQHVDLLVLGGLNEGVWPPEADADPWMSRPMRRDFGLPPPERRIGLSAHDFVQAFCAPEVVLTRATRADGAPTVPSRWLQRLDAVLRACGNAEPWSTAPWLAWAGALDRPDAVVEPKPPAPCPPLAARPRTLSVTAIETWMRDPYAIYAKSILALKALQPIDENPGAAHYGSLVHGALHAFLEDNPSGPLPDDALATLLDLGRRALEQASPRPGLLAFWGPRFARIATWFVATENARRGGVLSSYGEIDGVLEIAAPFGSFRLTARADRIDRLTGGGLAVIDYKTGTPPKPAEVAAGYAPQLPLEAAIARAGGFAGIAAAPVEQLLFWHLNGNGEGGSEKSAGKDAAQLAADALDGLRALVAVFDDAATPYRARPHPERAPRYSDYLHLARVKEWSAGDEEDA
jgi:ATP-dependent helicase/nuclease subunit B